MVTQGTAWDDIHKSFSKGDTYFKKSTNINFTEEKVLDANGAIVATGKEVTITLEKGDTAEFARKNISASEFEAGK